ncbi:MAG: hypothetical protein ACRDU4_13990, partial [Mycobacterium sp.]
MLAPLASITFLALLASITFTSVGREVCGFPAVVAVICDLPDPAQAQAPSLLDAPSADLARRRPGSMVTGLLAVR